MSEAPGFLPPPGPLRNRHVQTVLASGPLRRPWVRWRTRRLRRLADKVTVDAGDGIRLSARHNRQLVGPRARGLLVLIHGWEGSVDSNYVLECAARALAEGWDVVRLNLRDHGGSHALNRGIFHSGRIGETVAAVAEIARRWPQRPLALAGFSLGGNFALRIAVHAARAELPLAGVLAVCPAINAEANMRAIEGSALYHRYFMRKWRASLRRKLRAFPDARPWSETQLRLGMRELTRALVIRDGAFDDLEAYLDSYSLHGDRLAGVAVPIDILASRDDPIIPFADLAPLATIDGIRLTATDHGGHCGFIRAADLRSYCPDHLARWLARVERRSA